MSTFCTETLKPSFPLVNVNKLSQNFYNRLHRR